MINDYINEHNRVLGVFQSAALSDVWNQSAEVLLNVLRRGNKILIAGNGGSAADAQHFAAEIVGRFRLDRPGYPAIALTTDSSILTAIGNDYGFDKIFSRQIEALAEVGDCFVGITTSGNSENIINAFTAAKEIGVTTILLSGNDGGKAKNSADISLVVPSNETSHIQEMHLILYHAWCLSLDKNLV